MRVNRLMVEFDVGDRSAMFYYLLFSNLKAAIARGLAVQDKEHGYPLDIKEVYSMCKMEFIGNKVFIGYRPESYRTDNEQEIYKNLLDLEYGYNGREIRVIRKVLERVK